jgi:hypothetical protein
LIFYFRFAFDWENRELEEPIEYPMEEHSKFVDHYNVDFKYPHITAGVNNFLQYYANDGNFTENKLDEREKRQVNKKLEDLTEYKINERIYFIEEEIKYQLDKMNGLYNTYDLQYKICESCGKCKKIIKASNSRVVIEEVKEGDELTLAKIPLTDSQLIDQWIETNKDKFDKGWICSEAVKTLPKSLNIKRFYSKINEKTDYEYDGVVYIKQRQLRDGVRNLYYLKR